jgi:hypothetical protein
MSAETMPRCATCQHWERYEQPNPYDELPGWGECDLTMLGYCPGAFHEPEYPDTLAYAIDAEVRQAILRTHQTFGCVQHEPA